MQGLVKRSPDQWSYYVSLLDLLDKRSGEIDAPYPAGVLKIKNKIREGTSP